MILAELTYTAPELMLIIGALTSMAVAIITAWRTSAKSDENAKQAAAGAKATITEVGKVHELVNDRATKQDALNAELREEIRKLIAMVAQKDQDAAVLADRKVQAETPGIVELHRKVETTAQEIVERVDEAEEGIKHEINKEVKKEVAKELKE